MAAVSKSSAVRSAAKAGYPLHLAPKARQRGYILLLLTFLVTGIAATVFLSAWNTTRTVLAQEQKTDLALQQAKAAVIAWSATHPSLPGMLPCPEDTEKIGLPSEGQADNSCSSTMPVYGRLAWRTLGMDRLTDATGEQLWYVLSPGFRGSSDIPINSESSGQLMLDSQPVGAVALIVAPGAPLPGQDRTIPTAANPPDIAQYLDGTNNNGDGAFTAIPVDGNVNDRVLAIYPSDLLPAVEKRVANEVRYSLLEYYCGVGKVDAVGNCTAPPENGYFPRPAAFSDATCITNVSPYTIPAGCDSAATGYEGRIPANFTGSWDAASLLRGTGPTWFQKNRWRELVYYAVAPACIEGTVKCSGAGYLTVQSLGTAARTNIRVTIVLSGKHLGVTIRSKTALADYLEDQNASAGDNTFALWPPTAGTSFNDHVVTIP